MLLKLQMKKKSMGIWKNIREISQSFETKLKVLHVTSRQGYNLRLKQLLDLCQKLQHDTEILEIPFYMEMSITPEKQNAWALK